MIDLNNGYAEVADHVGHEIECVNYAAGENVALECVTCGMVLIDFDRPDPEDPDGSIRRYDLSVALTRSQED